MSKSLNFIILTLFVLASTESILILSISTNQEYKPYDSSVLPPNTFCPGLTFGECLIKVANVPYYFRYPKK